MTNQQNSNSTPTDHQKSVDSNIELSRQVLHEIYRHGVRDVIFCAGARNAPLVLQLEKTIGFKVWSFFEERSAGFFALGRARATRRPVAVITTSGTAVAELLPAVVEAFYSGVPLVLLTADRPKRLRGTGAPQSIIQPGIFSHYVTCSFDLEKESLNLGATGSQASRPIHVNVCFDEPLLDRAIESLILSAAGPGAEESSGEINPMTSLNFQSVTADTILDSFEDFFSKSKNPIVVVGTLSSLVERAACKQMLLNLKFPVYLEGTSGLREDVDLKHLAIKSGDRLLGFGLRNQLYDGVIRLGGVPTVRVWRDLDDLKSAVSVLSIHHLEFAGLGRGQFLQTSLSAVALLMLTGAFEKRGMSFTNVVSSSAKTLLSLDSKLEEKVGELLRQFSLSESSWVHRLSKMVGKDDLMYVGNSLSIRQWDNFAGRDHRVAVEANRGVNGIDGQISTFLGMARSDVHNWGLFGDLTTLYNLDAPWVVPSLGSKGGTIFVMNNSGGKIFDGIFKSELFQNNHCLDFKKWAEMWNLAYECWRSIDEVEASVHVGSVTSRWRVVEIRPDVRQSKEFNSQYEGIWKSVEL